MTNSGPHGDTGNTADAVSRQGGAEPATKAPTVVVAGGGTAGHIEPAMALADAVMRLRPDARVVALGTERGLENQLVPARGYQLELVPPVPLPRKPSAELLRLPLKVRDSVRKTRKVLDEVGADVVVGFGGYVALPAYLAARGRVPIVVHEANKHPGLANKIGARFAKRVAVGMKGTPLSRAEVVGIPLRHSITSLDRAALRAEAREYFQLDPDAPTLLVFGGSQGARSLNTAVSGAAEDFAKAGVGVLHAHGPKNSVVVREYPGRPAYVPVPYLDRMDLAYAAADLVLCRSGAMTVAEVSAVGLPAVFVPLPHGNGEQALNAEPAVAAGAALLVPDAELTQRKVADEVVPLVTDRERLAKMSAAAVGLGHGKADEVLAGMVLGALDR
ncbi:UDP-N-acetylglucosamine--N-acetylmuramyl-(pentapeptide) pyrophosphoryl-undecaprenol N-acetylglucosamine transferase [Prauserella marina]|uniref:UDP-N-acetylglucosamine--N-acetylmuramyl-(pentapeptide) pyrophosphoryl-undecaprenol N-acetylglucosamine transferase n=1 Tax=Prauserella marina TaxID=530584 RepID=A0A1G6UT94_9PSEU|nr:UDP-N-acetylglucosamine-N-acetylmuramylpentapeptide N-acetylglucosamine transferase [Prauserella marina]SDD43787.1 UDP-N-acetylglucosamine--N-acetylmuramyl-(pentapeptide) pyrophosphoryl-undecaprenol N-acetylglucosamine transferase [Prauserella marina]